MFTKRDNHGAYIEVPDNDEDLVTLKLTDNGYVYIVRGAAVDKLARLEHLEIIMQMFGVDKK